MKFGPLGLLALVLIGALLNATATAHAQDTPYPVVLTMTGPATAVSGQQITYTVHYELTDASGVSQAGFRIRIPRNTSYVSTEVVSGPPGMLVAEEERFVYWGALGSIDQREGDVQLVVRIDSDFVGSLFADAYEPGTETPGSNAVETQVSAPGTLPETGNRRPADSTGLRVVYAFVMFAVVALAGAGLAARSMKKTG